MSWGRERRVSWIWLWSQPTWDPMTHCWTHWTKFRFQKGCFSTPTVFNYWSADKEGMTCLTSLPHLRFHVMQGENYLLELPTSPAAKETPSWCLHQVGTHSSISWPANLVHLSPCNTNLTLSSRKTSAVSIWSRHIPPEEGVTLPPIRREKGLGTGLMINMEEFSEREAVCCLWKHNYFLNYYIAGSPF